MDENTKQCFAAIKTKDVHEVAWLLDGGVNVNARDDTRWQRTLLHQAILFSSTAAVRLLLDKNADIMMTNSYGQTPLQYAAIYFRTSIAALLLYFVGGRLLTLLIGMATLL